MAQRKREGNRKTERAINKKGRKKDPKRKEGKKGGKFY